ncbi:SAM hydrolase/SAM-dependent halogenase family protein [Bythopirellula polymerisocia]|uniref:Adenosyl-chloride synthase n=1 Tax=Bythopirellula polymerisocia TaxID=2528003 RepID=A0A5C6CV61_9BACT|nr:SAM-dependent chlorinase/fluorinase [Bythopirellula polymerisocia]TWU27331.1 Adenosyl-chloride synthase [Bythopirellula polymerisocia]
MSNYPIITLTTDFGASSPYVAAMKGVILSINSQVQLVDITHAIPPQKIRLAAQVLADTTSFYPPDTIHVAVVDPGVGTSRAIVYAEIADQRYVCPNNGLLDRLADRHQPTKMIRVSEPKYFRTPVAPTFHGRDIMAPVAAHLSLGLEPEKLGPRQAELVKLEWRGAKRMANRIQGEVVAVDSFGNLVTNITREMLADVPTDETVAIRCDDHETRSIFQTYGDQPPMTLIALIGSNDQLEIAIVDDSAKIMLGVGVGAPVEVSW